MSQTSSIAAPTPLNSTGYGICFRHFFYPVKVALLWTVDHHPCYTCAACSFLLGDLTPLMIPVVHQSARLPPVCRSMYVFCLRRASLQPFSPLTTAFPSVFGCWELHALFHFPYNHSLFSLDSKASAPLPPGSSSCQEHWNDYTVRCHWMTSRIFPEPTAELDSNDLIFFPEHFCP